MNKHQRKRVSKQRRMEKRGLGEGNSKYAQKVKAGNQMYGNGRLCCAHGLGAPRQRWGGSS